MMPPCYRRYEVTVRKDYLTFFLCLFGFRLAAQGLLFSVLLSALALCGALCEPLSPTRIRHSRQRFRAQAWVMSAT